MDNSVPARGDYSPVLLPKLTFKDLQAERKALVGPDQRDRNEFASSLTALRSFMAALGVGDDDACTPLLGLPHEEFEARLSDFESRTTVQANTVVAYRSRLRRWNEIARDLAERSCITPPVLADELMEAVSAYRRKHPKASEASIARAAGMSATSFRNWLRGVRALDTPKNVEWARSLENVLSLRPAALTSRLMNRCRQSKSYSEVVSESKVRLSRFGLNNIRLRPPVLPPKLKDFFAKFETFKTAAVPLYNAIGETLKRSKEKWRVLKSNSGERSVPTAEIMMIRVTTLTGWLMLPTTEEEARHYVMENRGKRARAITDDDVQEIARHFVGRGLKPDEITPAHLVDPEVLGSFIEWQKARNGSASWDTVADALALLAAETGFLFQQVEYAWDYSKLNLAPVDAKLLSSPEGRRLYNDLRGGWADICARWRTDLAGLRSFTRTQRSKRTHDRLLPIIEHPDPLSIINKLIQAHASDRPVGKLEQGHPGAYTLALWFRDQLLLRMLTFNPLRNRNFREMRYLAKPTPRDKGNLYQKNGAWMLHFEPEEFKNEQGAAKDPYDVEVPADLWPLIEVYLFRARPILLRERRSDLVFVTMSGKPFDTRSLSTVIWSLTSRYMQGIADLFGIRSHAFRHIIATAWLRAHPQDYLTVAQILHDDLNTVMKNYAHNKPVEGLRRYSEWCSQKIKPLALD